MPKLNRKTQDAADQTRQSTSSSEAKERIAAQVASIDREDEAEVLRWVEAAHDDTDWTPQE